MASVQIQTSSAAAGRFLQLSNRQRDDLLNKLQAMKFVLESLGSADHSSEQRLVAHSSSPASRLHEEVQRLGGSLGELLKCEQVEGQTPPRFRATFVLRLGEVVDIKVMGKDAASKKEAKQLCAAEALPKLRKSVEDLLRPQAASTSAGPAAPLALPAAPAPPTARLAASSTAGSRGAASAAAVSAPREAAPVAKAAGGAIVNFKGELNQHLMQWLTRAPTEDEVKYESKEVKQQHFQTTVTIRIGELSVGPHLGKVVLGKKEAEQSAAELAYRDLMRRSAFARAAAAVRGASTGT